MPHVELVEVGDAQNILWEKRPLYSQYNPRRGAQRGLPVAQQATLYFVPSPLLGYGLDVFLAQLPENSHLLVIENDPALRHITESALATWQNQQVSYFFNPNEQVLHAFMKTLLPLGIQNVHYFFVNQGQQIHQTTYQSLFTFCQQALAIAQSNELTLQKNGDIWFSHLLKNLSFLPHSYALKVSQKPDPYVIAGAGPSLEYSLSDLKKYRHSFRLLAVDTALPCLTAAGIDPDLVFVLEASHHNLQDFILKEQKPVSICCDLTSLPQQARMSHVRSHFFLTSFAEIQLLDRLQQAMNIITLPALGSVGVAALAFVLQQTSGPIFYTGLDFAFFLGKSHARGTYSHTNMLNSWTRMQPNHTLTSQLSRPLMQYQNAEGEKVYSDPLLIRYAQMASQGNPNRIFCLSDLGLSLGYQTKTLHELTQLPAHTFLASQPGFSRVSHMQNFIQNEIVLLDDFFSKNNSCLPALDYLRLGTQCPDVEIFENKKIQQRAEFFYGNWLNLSKIYEEAR